MILVSPRGEVQRTRGPSCCRSPLREHAQSLGGQPCRKQPKRHYHSSGYDHRGTPYRINRPRLKKGVYFTKFGGKPGSTGFIKRRSFSWLFRYFFDRSGQRTVEKGRFVIFSFSGSHGPRNTVFKSKNDSLHFLSGFSSPDT